LFEPQRWGWGRGSEALAGIPQVADVAPMQITPAQLGVVLTPHIEDIVERAMRYVRAGLPIHFSGPAGTGKTTLAMYVAAQLGRPVILLHGDEELDSSDLVGGEYGYHAKRVVDNFIHTVLKVEEDVTRRWVDNRITVACKYGLTLLYDEFTRSRPEANNVLLSILAEKTLDLPAARGGQDSQLRVHPDFSAIFTSNPEEYAGVHRAQDALRDRMVTINLGYFDRETEIAITEAKGGVEREAAERIVDIVRDFREQGKYARPPTVRACITIARVLKQSEARALASDQVFVQTCMDILASETQGVSDSVADAHSRKITLDLIGKRCPARKERPEKAMA